jgi:hypothetical protein
MMRRHGRREARLYPMPVITPVTFSGCRATMSNGEDLDLHRAPLLRIQDWDEFLPLGQRICEVEDKTDDGFVAKYIGPPARASGPCFT